MRNEMTKKAIAEQLNARKVYNDWDITKDGHPMIHNHVPSGYRDVSGHAIVLSLKGRRFKDKPWYQDGSLWFGYWGRKEKKEAIEKALAWVEEHFPGMKMAKSPFSRDAFVLEEDLKEAIERKAVENENQGTD